MNYKFLVLSIIGFSTLRLFGFSNNLDSTYNNETLSHRVEIVLFKYNSSELSDSAQHYLDDYVLRFKLDKNKLENFVPPMKIKLVSGTCSKEHMDNKILGIVRALEIIDYLTTKYDNLKRTDFFIVDPVPSMFDCFRASVYLRFIRSY